MKVTLQAREDFLRQYQHIRRSERRGSRDAEFYRALPYHDLSGHNKPMWRMRAKSYRFFECHVLPALESAASRPLDILDLGAGNCWMSNRLALRNHRVVAVDIFNDDLDGLGAWRHYSCHFSPLEAEFDSLPFRNAAFDLAIYNSSFHYSTDYLHTLGEVRRCLRTHGRVIILDSPIYKRPEHGRRMAEERHASFQKQYGFRSDAVPSIEFLDLPTLDTLANGLKLTWEIHRPWYGLAWHVRPLKAWLKRRRPPSRFWILVGKFQRP